MDFFLTLIWLVLFMASAVPSVVLGLGTWWLVKGAQTEPRNRAILAACLLPPLAVISAFAGFIVYGVWCETVRGVDAIGPGDYWRAPLGSGYYLTMDDLTDGDGLNASIATPWGKGVGYEIFHLGYNDKFIYFEDRLGKFTLITKATS